MDRSPKPEHVTQISEATHTEHMALPLLGPLRATLGAPEDHTVNHSVCVNQALPPPYHVRAAVSPEQEIRRRR
ncbi:hypothetical protein NDU88_005091 [Pleurodeles waltl]|uniref:Uncharacterized protein n=1 Tax=Pleurodeles waltl TaxID=8319 RepID=A0AAV7T9L5_PLEWA|nr:hypothetical protein NDU88_005091 [Pleurodeles waltl]